MKTFEPFTVEDVQGRRYHLITLVGEGGQGRVYLDDKGRHLVKLRPKEGTIAVENLRQHFRRIRQIDLTGIPITRPLELLRPPHVGYVMEYLTGMEPIERLIDPQGEKKKHLIEWYNAGGGLRRRLGILARCAAALHRLHSKGLVYGDINPKNIFVSSAIEEQQVYFIDIDNLIYESSPSQGRVWFRGYGAPEVVLGEHGNDSLTDAFSFAIVAYECLALDHPLIGDMVHDGGPDLESDVALTGRLPWIHHSTDTSNYSSHGFSPDKERVLSARLFELFQKTFEQGLQERQKRPGLGEWSRRLYLASQFTLLCETCKGTYYADKAKCPWCGVVRSPYLLASIDVVRPAPDGSGLEIVRANETGFCVQWPAHISVTRQTIGYLDESDQPIVELHLDKKQMLLRSLDGRGYWVTAPDWQVKDGLPGKRSELIDDSLKIFSLSWRVHLGSIDEVHRVLRLALKAGG